AESLAFAVIAEAGVGTSWRMNALSVSAVRAVFLTSNLAQNGLSRGANFVHHPVLELVSAYFVSDDRDFFLWQFDGFSASSTDVTAHWTSCSSLRTNARSAILSEPESKPLSYPTLNLGDFRSIVFCEPHLGRG